MSLCQLSNIERERVVRSTLDGSPMQRTAEVIHDVVIYRAFTDRGLLFSAMLPKAFDELWAQAEQLIKEVTKKQKKEKRKQHESENDQRSGTAGTCPSGTDDPAPEGKRKNRRAATTTSS
jgi:hypothetical protein